MKKDREIECLQARISELEQIVENYDQVKRIAEEDLIKEQWLFDNISMGFAYHQIVLDTEQRPVDYIFLRVNDTFEKLTGLKKDEIIGRKATEVLPGIENDPADWIGRYGRVALTGEVLHFEQYSEQLQKLYSVTAYSPANKYFAAIFNDITEIKQTIAKEHFQSTLIANMFDAVYMVRATDGIIVYANLEFEKLFGYSSKEMIGQHVSIVNAPAAKEPAETAREIIDILAREGIWEGEVQNINKDGTVFWCFARVSTFDHPEYGKILLAVHIDISERKRIEQKLLDHQRLLNEVEKITYIGGWEMDMITREANWTRGTYDIAELDYGDPIPGPDEHISWYLPEYRPLIAEAMRRLIEEDVPLEFEAILKTAKNNLKWCRAIGKAVREDGKCVKVYGTFQDITESKLSSDTLKISEKKYRGLFNGIRDAILVANTAREIIECNPALTALFGYTLAEIKGKQTVFLYASQEQFMAMGQAIKEHQGDEAPFLYTIDYRKKNGEIFPGETGVYFLKDDNGEITGFIGLIRDISDRVRAEQALHESEYRFRTLVESSPLGIMQLDRDLHIIYENAAIKTLLGVPKGEDSMALGQDFRTVSSAIKADLLDDIEALRNGQQVRKEFSFKSLYGKESELALYGVPLLRDDQFEGALLMVVDVTEQRRNEALLNDSVQTLAEKNQFIESIMDLSPDIMYIYDVIKKENVYSNEGIQKVLGYSVKQVQEMGSNLIATLMHPDDFQTYLELTYPKYAVARDNELIIHQFRMKHKDGSWCWLDSTEIIFLRQDDGTPRQIFGVIHDITEQKLVNDKLVDAQQEIEKNISFLDTVIDSSPFAMWVSDSKGVMIRSNSTLCKLLQVTDADLIGKYNVLEDENLIKQGLMSNVREVFDMLKPTRITLYWVGTDSGDVDLSEAKKLWVDASMFPITDAKGKLANVVCQWVDITDQKLALEKIRESENRFRSLFQSMKAGVAVYRAVNNGKEFIFEDLNQTGEKLTNVSRDDVIGKKVQDVFPGVKEMGLFEVFKKVWKTGKPVAHPVSEYKDDQLSFWTENYVYKLPSGDIVAIFDDQTIIKQAEAQLLHHARELEQKVNERTSELQQKIAELERFQTATIDRELRMKELRDEIVKLKQIKQ
ncbi:MAG: PAS domain S-box protein [Candidatus Neomarinimicrobiota bacterium]